MHKFFKIILVLATPFALAMLLGCDKTAENTNKPVIIQGFEFAVNSETTTPVGTLQIAPSQTLNIKVKFTDPDAGDHPDPSWYTFSWAVELINSSSPSFNPNDYFIAADENPAIWVAPDVTGFYRFHVEVRDRYMAPSTDQVTIQVSSNKKPLITSLEVSNTAPYVNDIVTLTAHATDPDGNLPLEYAWQATGGFFTLENENIAKWTSPTAGSFTITVTVSDQAGGSTSRSVPLTVQANHPPIVEGWSLEPENPISVGDLVTITVTASDADGDPLEYNWSADKGSFTTISKNVATWRAPSTAGTCTVSCVVEDNKGGSDTATIVIVVND